MDDLNGKRYMISFFRFASCPFCNLRVHELVTRFHEFGEGFTIVLIFDSPLDNLQRHADKHKAPFPILADETNKYYKEYGVERSFVGMLKGMFGRLPTLLKGMFVKGYIPVVFKGSILTMPVDILVNEIDKEKSLQIIKNTKLEFSDEDWKDFDVGDPVE